MVVKVTAPNIQDKITTGSNAATLINDSKRAVNQVVDVVNDLPVFGDSASKDTGTAAGQVPLNSDLKRPAKYQLEFEGVSAAVAAVSANPANYPLNTGIKTLSYQTKVECEALAINYPDGGGADYVVGTGFGVADGGSIIDAGSKQLKLIVGEWLGLKSINPSFTQANNRVALGVYPVQGSMSVVRSDSDVDAGVGVTLQVQRLSKHDEGFLNPKAIRAYTRVDNPVSQTEWALSGEIDSYTNRLGTGNTATSGVARKFGTAPVFAGHFQSQDKTVYTVDTDVTSIVGIETNLIVNGPDHPTQNAGNGLRQGIDLIAISGSDGSPEGAGEVGVGMRVRCDSGVRSNGYFRLGISLEDNKGGNTNPMGTALRIRTRGDYGIRSGGAKQVADILLESNAPVGILLNGRYSTAAIRMPANQVMAWENTSVITTGYESATNSFVFKSGASNRVSFSLSEAPSMSIDGLRVVSKRGLGWGVPTGTGNKTSFNTATVTTEQLAQRVKALLDDLNVSTGGHGLIG